MTEQKTSQEEVKRVAIVGGGITGLYCAWVLGEQQGYQVDLFETSNRLGGRIRTVRLDKNNNELGEAWTDSNLNFYVEFGPMRLELDKQLLVKALLDELGIRPKPEGKEPEGKSYLVPFPSYTSPASEHDPKYDLRPEEEGKSPMELMILAFARILAHLEMPAQEAQSKPAQEPQSKPAQGPQPNLPPFKFTEAQGKLKESLNLASALGEPVSKSFIDWLKTLEPEHFWEIQTLGAVKIPDDDEVFGTKLQKPSSFPLYRLGFWNLLSNHLSHDALNKIRDLGTFYHLLPENPNAAEWLVWWMIGLSASDNMQGIFGGMECIVDEMRQKIEELGPDRVKTFTGTWITAIEAGNKDGAKLLRLRKFDKATQCEEEATYHHVILAVPRRAAQAIQKKSESVFANSEQIESLLESSFGFPMVKTFVVLKERWWEKNNMANRAATRMPTRELHYWKPHGKDDSQGLVMAYTDRPASAFWADYVPSGAQIDAHRGLPKVDPPAPNSKPLKPQYGKPLKRDLRALLIDRMARYLDENNGEQKVRVGDIAWYGIRDWGRAPFSGANHAWRPGRKYWVVMRRLADIEVPESAARIHVCGEAYSDYHGFLEGSLRSAAYVLHRILRDDTQGNRDEDYRKTIFRKFLITGGGAGAVSGATLLVEEKYLDGLRSWALSLDEIPDDAEFAD